MLGRVVLCELLVDAMRLLGFKGGVQASRTVGSQVVADQHASLGIGILLSDEGAQKISGLGIGRPLGNTHAPVSSEGLDPQKDIGFAQAFILVVFFGRLPSR